MGINATKYRDRYIKRAARVLPIIQPGKPFAPEAIDKIVGGAYSFKFVFYLRELGFQFSQQKDGRKIVSYTLISEPDDAAAIRGATASKSRKSGAAKTATPKVKVAKVKVVKSAVAVDTKRIKSATEKAAIKAKNLETLKAVAAKRKALPKKKVREFDDVTEQFGTSGEVGTSFNVDRDWDSVEGLDLSKLL